MFAVHTYNIWSLYTLRFLLPGQKKLLQLNGKQQQGTESLLKCPWSSHGCYMICSEFRCTFWELAEQPFCTVTYQKTLTSMKNYFSLIALFVIQRTFTFMLKGTFFVIADRQQYSITSSLSDKQESSGQSKCGTTQWPWHGHSHSSEKLQSETIC